MVEIADSAASHRTSRTDARRFSTSRAGAPAPLATLAVAPWQDLAARAIEPNGYHLPDWELAVDATAPGRTGASVLAAWRDGEAGVARLIGVLPAISLWRACRIPLPALVSADPYGTLGTPLLDRDSAHDAVAALLDQARDAGTHALVLRNVAVDGAAMRTFAEVLGTRGLRPRVLNSYARACLDATRDAEELLRDALGAKKLKELRRQRNRLAEHGEVRFEAARTPGEVAAALETFLKLEASGWKAKRGTALVQSEGDAAFIRRATAALAGRGQCEIVTLHAGATAVAAAIVPRHQDRAFYFKLGVDERFAKLSPGVQLTLDLTRHLCADPAIATVDSTANAGHPMIDPIWRGRLVIGDVLIPLRPNDPMVSLIDAALRLHRFAEASARGAIRFIRRHRQAP